MLDYLPIYYTVNYSLSIYKIVNLKKLKMPINSTISPPRPTSSGHPSLKIRRGNYENIT